MTDCKPIFKEKNYSKRLTSGILGYPHRKRLFELENLCKKYSNKIVLDIGCGDLFFDKFLIPGQKKFIGCDLGWENSLIQANKNISKNNWDNVYKMNVCGEFLPIKDNIFDLILCFETLVHVDDENMVGNEISRVSKNDAILIISVPTEFGIILLFKEIFRDLITSSIYRGSFSKSIRQNKYSIKELFFASLCHDTTRVKRILHSHKGYDYFLTIKKFERNWSLKDKKNYPFKFLPNTLSYGCFLVFQKIIKV